MHEIGLPSSGPVLAVAMGDLSSQAFLLQLPCSLIYASLHMWKCVPWLPCNAQPTSLLYPDLACLVPACRWRHDIQALSWLVAGSHGCSGLGRHTKRTIIGPDGFGRATRGGVAMRSWPLLLPTFDLSSFFLSLRHLLLTHFGKTPVCENLFPPISSLYFKNWVVRGKVGVSYGTSCMLKPTNCPAINMNTYFFTQRGTEFDSLNFISTIN